MEAIHAARFDRNAPGDDDHYTQPGDPFRLLGAKAQGDTIKNIVGHVDGIEGPLVNHYQAPAGAVAEGGRETRPRRSRRPGREAGR
ncbi:hypothetical protein DDQ68_04270 [Hymenobacter nivis]|uniref:Uncharacterized protein n=1 Tax=Hymenobacter nivis TaxID=1850093 RepID=A0A2Z3GLM3_9BACT|nr:hypothetical protein DDQ68_04270 [Hymenobacter nivis]